MEVGEIRVRHDGILYFNICQKSTPVEWMFKCPIVSLPEVKKDIYKSDERFTSITLGIISNELFIEV